MKLKPCPFCGGEPALIEAMGEYWYNCTDCCASVNMATSKKEAAKLWNKRCHGICDKKQRKAELADAKKLASDLICENQGLKHKIDMMNKE